MFVEHKNDIELEGESNNATEASISQKNLGFIVGLISKQIYRNPIGSVIREITSNCFDAHVEAGVNEPVIVAFDSDDLGKYIKFVDSGIGMSPERIKTVFLSYGESTKRHTNDQIGGFGIGGKSPLAYTESFFITTVYDKMQYEYIVHEGTNLPTIELLFTEAVERRNGTEIKIYFKDPEDYYTFINECKKQLVYFDNVVFRPDWHFKNDYQIYEGTHFKLRSDVNTVPHYNHAHLCIGKVAYPIDYDILDRNYVSIPIALKFEIGELIVTPERESLRYIKVNGKETKQIINEKLDAAIEELKELYYKQENLNCDTLTEYFYHKSEKPKLTIGTATLDLTGIVEPAVKCRMLEGYIGDPDIRAYEAWYTIHNYHKRDGKGRVGIKRDLTAERLEEDAIYFTKVLKRNPVKLEYLYRRLNVKEIYLTTLNFKKDGWEKLRRFSGIKGSIPYNTTLTKQLSILYKALLTEISNKSKNYDEIVVPKEYVERLQATKIKRKEDQIVVYDCTEKANKDKKKFVNPSDLARFTGFIIYGYEEDVELLNNFVKLFDNSKYNTHKDLPKSKAVKILKIATTNRKHFKTKNCVYVNHFIGDNKVFKHFATALAIKKESNYRKIRYNGVSKYKLDDLLQYININVNDAIKEIEDFSTQYLKGKASIDTIFIDSIIETAKQYNLLDHNMYDTHLRLNKYFNKMELLSHIRISEEIIVYIIDYFVAKKKNVCELWTKPEAYEIELMKESIAKAEYLLETVDQDEQECKSTKEIFETILNYHKYAA